MQQENHTQRIFAVWLFGIKKYTQNNQNQNCKRMNI